MSEVTDRIERKIVLKAPLARVWRAISNAEEFGAWFGVALKGQHFVAGQRVRGPITYPGYEHIIFDVDVIEMVTEKLLSFRWHPYPADLNYDYSQEPTTLVEFKLSEIDGGTLVK
ncbi:MAG TPA: SRPBCC family protein, partial [Burkholderiaceae bacterium]|nr:SRPBCC family protein [Burkholderiaceae bacterium]